MSYSTPQSVRLALVPSLAGSLPVAPTNTAADLSDAQLQDAINEADAMIDGYLANVYVTPVAATGETPAIPHPVDYWSRDIAAYLATCTYRGQMNIESTDPISLRYNAVLGFLKDVSTGKASLPLPRNGASDAGDGAAGAPYNPYLGDLWTPDDFVTPYASAWRPNGTWNGTWYG